jgi:hypothetical protein
MRLLIPLAALTIVTTLPTPAPQATPLSPLSFMTGCWERRGRTTLVEEQWMRPRGNVMLGMGRTTRSDSVLDYEQVLIRAIEGRVQYEANPAGQAPNIFTARTVTDSFVIFVDPEHDFPQAVGYRKRGNDSLIAFIAGTRGDRTDTINFPYARVRCEG